MSTSKAAALVTLAALAVTIAMAWPVMLEPGERIYGHEIDGRHHDPYTVMWQFEHGPPRPPYRQPLVDDIGHLAARGIGPVAAFNVIVLVTFPLSALATFLLARYLGLSNTAASVAAFAFAFAPPHMAHAAYHPHTAQTQWIPVYFLALVAALDRLSAARLALVVLATMTLMLSNLYGAFVCGIMTPLVVLARKWGHTRMVNWSLSPLFFGALAFPAADLARYGAQWFAYALPPADHPLWGSVARSVWEARGMTGAVLEQQVSLSWALLALAAYAAWRRVRERRAPLVERDRRLRVVPLLAALAAASAVLSLAPPAGDHPWWIPSTWIYPLLPMFRAYARFAFVTHLMIALLAGIGVMLLFDRRAMGQHRRAGVAAVLLLVAAAEYAPLPARSRDVLPTPAHRWVAGSAAAGRVLDCGNAALAGLHLSWLMRRDVTALPPALPSCQEQQAASRAATLGYRYAIIRRTAAASSVPPGFVLVRDFPGAAVYDIVAPAAPAVVARIDGFYPIERRGAETWRWMEKGGRWRLQAREETTAALELELSAYERPRSVALTLNGRAIATIGVGTERAWHSVGHLRLTPGQHELAFVAVDAPSAAPPPDRRLLSVRLHDWRWR